MVSRHMFRNLLPVLAEHFHVVAPDYPGYGYSDSPSVEHFAYTFDHLEEVWKTSSTRSSSSASASMSRIMGLLWDFAWQSNTQRGLRPLSARTACLLPLRI